MDNLATALLEGLAQATTFDALLFMIFGTVIGYVFGILPGLQSITAMSVFLPLTYWWTPAQAMYFFAGIIGAAGNGGAVTAIVLNMPGTAQNAATTLEGYPMTRAGRAVFALNLSAASSWLGAVFGVVVLIALVPLFLPFLLSFGPAETFWVAVFGLVTMVLAVAGSPAKGLIAIAIGVFLAIIGMGGPRLPVPRFTFGSGYLLDGLEIVVVIIGFLVVSECLLQVAGVWARGRASGVATNAVTRISGDWKQQMIDGWKAPFRHPGIFLRSSALGTAVGALPGVGGTVAQFLSYNLAVATTKDASQIGKGAEDALVATEAATNSKEGGALFPTLLFGIPGNAEMALVLAAWQIHGLEPGPSFMTTHGALAWALVFGLLFSNLVASIGTAAASPWLARLPGFDMGILAPAVLVASLMSAYTVRSNFLDLGLLLAIGVFGAFLRLYGYSVIGVVIGFVLGDVIERNFYTALQSSLGDYSVFVGSPVAAVLAAITAIAALVCGVKVARGRREAADAAGFSTGAILFAGLMLAATLALLWQAMAPGWRGGSVAPGVLGLASLLLALVLLQGWRGREATAVPEAKATLRLALLLLAALAVALWLGFLAGMAAFLAAFWIGVQRRPLGRALALVAIFALALPAGFSWLVESQLWRGVVAPLVPGLLGGEVMPSP
ncbi:MULTISPECIES: tripartite tricarboxylate transporter permease [Roseomonadaceae]|uniref:Tripartite tricarboxylate transporter permease n=1 Tax=Falsiroseomonas oleicola TaxID=2801474 RepID=A0ABS6HBU7_9PROT|nr:tripartite tricarboxylate transporter permease [Roseomonas oleicola]MBU8546202.1 tripartite tricarboxylate transporter permease [Roseomonas oleicola]